MKETKPQKKRDFHFYYRIGLCSLAVLLFAMLAIELRYPSVPDIYSQILALAFGASFTAYLTVTTYDYISKTAQTREWKRQIQMGIWERVYLPIYERLVEDLRLVQLYEHSGFAPWYEAGFTTNKTLLEITNKPYLQRLETHIEIRERYQNARLASLQAAERAIQAYHDNLFPEGSGKLTELMKNDILYFMGRAVSIPPARKEDYVRQYNLLKGRYPNLSVDPLSALQILADTVGALPETVEFLSAHSEMVDNTKALLASTKKVVQKPYRI